MRASDFRVALFPCTYTEIDGVANTSKQFEAFAKEHGFPFLVIHAGPRDEVTTDGSITRIQLRRGPATFPLDGHHEFDLLFLRHYRRIENILRDFNPDFVHVTGPSDVGILGLLLALNLRFPLAASWQTNIHQFARCRVSKLLSSLPASLSAKIAAAAETGSFRAAGLFYRRPRLLFAPNRELVQLLEKTIGKPCFLMSHSVDTEAFNPKFRDRSSGPFRIGYVGRLTPEKNVRLFAQLERDLLASGHQDFRIILVGEGSEKNWLRQNVSHAEFKGWLTGKDLSVEFADMDAFVSLSETDTFGLAVLESLSSGVPAVVAAPGGPACTVEHGKSGYVANRFEEFASSLSSLMNQPELHASMRVEARRRAISIGSWTEIFSGMYEAYERFAAPATEVGTLLLDDAGKIANT